MERRVLFSGLLLMTMLACGASPVTLTPSPAPIPTNTFTSTPAPAPTSTPVELTLRITDEVVNCRFGPGLVYELVDELHEDQTARVVGRNNTSTWWYIRDPGNPDGLCWVSSDVAQIRENAQDLPVIGPPSTSVKKVSLIVDPTKMVVDCPQFPQTFFFEAKITANGPALVTWQWEASTGVSSDIGTIIFDEAGTKVINEYYQVGSANDYWVKLHILTPNPVTEQANFHVECSP